MRATPAGLEIIDIIPGSFGDRAGLAVGDLLVSFGDAPVVDRRELETLMRVFHAGDTVAATVVRGKELLDAEGAL